MGRFYGLLVLCLRSTDRLAQNAQNRLACSVELIASSDLPFISAQRERLPLALHRYCSLGSTPLTGNAEANSHCALGHDRRKTNPRSARRDHRGSPKSANEQSFFRSSDTPLPRVNCERPNRAQRGLGRENAVAQDWRSRPKVDRRSNTGSAFANHHLTPIAPDLPSFTNEVCLARAPEIEANSVSEDFNGTSPCMVAMIARNYLDASGANVNPF